MPDTSATPTAYTMSKKLKVKIGALVAVVVVSLIAMFALLSGMQNQLTLESYTNEMQQEAAELPDLLENASSETAQNEETFDAIYQSKAQTVAFMANNETGFEQTDAKMAELRELLSVDNILVVKRDGTVVAKAADTKAKFGSSRFNYLRDCLSTGEPSPAVEIELPEEDWLDRYYAAKIDDDTMIVIEQSPAELRELVETTGSLESVLKNVQIGQHGYMFAVSAQDYLIEYHPDEALVGTDAIDAGLTAENLEDGNFCTVNFNGSELYCGVTRIDDMYYIAAVPTASLASSGSITVGVIMFVFLVVIAAVALYGVFVLRDDERRGHEDEKDFGTFAGLRVNRRIAGKAAALSVVGLVAVLGISFYMQTLFALSSMSITNSERAEQIADTIERANDRADALTEQYSERYLSKARAAAYIIEKNPELATREKLQELADALQIQYVFTFNNAGTMTATNSSFANFTLSDDPESQSYEFRKLLQGVEYVVQDPMPDEVSGELRQYIGVETKDANGSPTGFVQIAIRTTRLENLLASVQIDHVLDGVKAGAEGFAFAVNKDKGHTIAYYPDDLLVGKKASEIGLTENQLKGGYSDYITVDGQTYYAASVETDDYLVYVAGPEGELMSERGPLTLATGGIALVCLAVVFCLLVIEPKGGALAGADTAAADADNGDGRMVDVQLDGRTLRTESAASRWLDRAFNWHEMTPEQKLGRVMRWFGTLAVIIVALATIFKDSLFERGSVFSYILSENWERGLNIFAITASIMFACVLATAAGIIQKILRMASRVLEARGVTMCRLASSVVKYAAVIGMLYWCLALLGVDTATLLASAGLLTFAVSLGAQGLVSDIISGLFIIFEGEFRVGDIIQMGAGRGTVIEIGVRTTKINDGSGNIMVVRNSSISNVVNMTKEASVAAIEVGIDYGESLERVENILAEELPNIRRRLPAIIDGPFYKGVSMMGDNSVNIKIVAKCLEGDRGGLVNDLNREIKLIFDKHDISIPYPQIVVNEPTVYKKATVAEKIAADVFNAEQKEASRGTGGSEDEDFDEANDSHKH